MSERIRTLDSRISFFAFADIITAVSGMLIFITLLLATDLGRPSKKSRSETADRELQQQLSDLLSQQLETDARIRHLQELLAAAETAPAPGKIEADIANLRTQLAAEQRKQSAVSVEISKSASALQARDAALGLTDLKATIERAIQEAESVARQDAKARKTTESLEQQVSAAQAQLLKLREREGKLWLIPDKSNTTKEPILVTVARTGAGAYAFDHPEKHQQWDTARAPSSFEQYLRNAKSLNQYVVFEVKPSGIQLFQKLLETARSAGFDVGFDALEEDKEVQGFSSPPPIDEPVPSIPPNDTSATMPVPQANASTNTSTAPAKPSPPPPSAQTNSPSHANHALPPPPAKSWWQRFLTWIGVN
jgi:chemotaxis protein histidine kinase CheA